MIKEIKMSKKEYIVSLNKGVDYAAFNQEMIATTGSGAIPKRSVDVANARPSSYRNTHYMLTDAEVTELKNDSRVYGITLLPELDDNIMIAPRALQTGDFSKTTLDRGEFLNWGMRRMNEATNPYSGSSVEGGYGYTLDGTGVDIVIMDSGLQVNHPEFQDTEGNSRVVELDWTTASGIAGMPAQSADYYRDFDGHGTHVAGTAAGKTYGWAKNAKIYSLKLAGLEGTGDSGTGTSVTYAFDCIKEWHRDKPIDPTTGAKRPTVVNMSWGYLRFYDSVSSMTYRGVEYTGTDIDTVNERWNFGLIPIFNGQRYITNTRITSVDVDMEELIDMGVHVIVAAGNRSHKIDIPAGDDYDNKAVTNTGEIFYHRGSSPYSLNAHIVGNIDSTIHIDGLEQKAASSETGPGVSVYAPGTDIMSAMSTINKFGATALNNPYPLNANFLINNISGTSMASPQVAGMLSLWLQINPSATPAQGLAFVNSVSKTEQLYDTASTIDYSTDRSLLGGNNRFAFNKFNSNVQLRIGNSIITEVQQPATYTLSSSAASVNEGSAFTITLTTTNVDDGTTIPYTITGVTSADINGSSLNGSFNVNNNTAQVTFNVTADTTTEGSETFVLTLDSLSTSQSITINDTSTTPVPTYTLAPAANNVDEGSTLTFNVTTTDIADATTLYWTVTNESDFTTSSGSFVVTSDAGSFSVTPTADTTTEGAETFTASIRTGSVSGTIVATSSSVTINDTSTTPGDPTYSVTPAANNVDEGSTLVINVSTANVADGTTLYWRATNSEDFATSSGSFVVTSDAGSFSVTPTADTTTEGSETFQIQIRTGSVSGTIVATSSSVTINDTSTTPVPTYDATPTANNVDEGSALTINVVTTNVTDSTTLYWTVTNESDFTTSSGNFTITSNAGSFSITPTADTLTEGAETFTVSIRTGSVSGTIVDTTDSITINDTSTTPAFSPDYTITVTNNGSGAYTLSGTDRNGAVSGDNQILAFNNGDKVRFSVNASGHPFHVKTAQVTGTGSQASGVDNNGSETGNVDWTIGSTGTFYYICQFHSAMTSTITVS